MTWIVDNFVLLEPDIPSAVIPAQAGIQIYPCRNRQRKKFPKFYVLDSRLRGNDGRS